MGPGFESPPRLQITKLNKKVGKKCITVAVIGVIKFREKYLMTKRYEPNTPYDGRWQFPGGGVEFGEDPEKAVEREVKEETGIVIKNCDQIPIIFSKTRNQGRWHGIFIPFLCRLNTAPKKIMLNEEATEYKWFTAQEILDTPDDKIFAGTKEIILKLRDIKLWFD